MAWYESAINKWINELGKVKAPPPPPEPVTLTVIVASLGGYIIDGMRFAIDEPMTPDHLRVARKWGLIA